MQIPEPLRALAQIGLGRGFLPVHSRLLRDPLAQLLTPVRRSDPYPVYEQIRVKGPLRDSTLGSTLLVDHALCHEVLRNRQFITKLPNEPFRGVELSLLTTDPPDHTRLRRLVAGAFAPGRMRQQEERIQQAVDRLLDDLEARLAGGPVDLMEEYAKPLPIFVIASLMGIPASELPTLARHGDAIAGVLDGLQSLHHYRAVVTARRELEELFRRLGEQRLRDPGPDIISDLAAGLDRKDLTMAEYQSLCRLILLAGFETTVNLIGNAVSALLDRPEAWRRVVADQELVDPVLEETLRWASPVQAVARATNAEVELGFRTLAPDHVLVVFLGAANRDPRVFERPEEFDLDRPNAADHLAFGHGLHHCLGRPLAMLESRIALTGLTTRLPGLRPAGRPTRRASFTLHGHSTLPVRL